MNQVGQVERASGGNAAEVGLARIEDDGQIADGRALERPGEAHVTFSAQLRNVDLQVIRLRLAEQVVPSVGSAGQAIFESGQSGTTGFEAAARAGHHHHQAEVAGLVEGIARGPVRLFAVADRVKRDGNGSGVQLGIVASVEVSSGADGGHGDQSTTSSNLSGRWEIQEVQVFFFVINWNGVARPGNLYIVREYRLC